jgi:hypothetical protein
MPWLFDKWKGFAVWAFFSTLVSVALVTKLHLSDVDAPAGMAVVLFSVWALFIANTINCFIRAIFLFLKHN